MHHCPGPSSNTNTLPNPPLKCLRPVFLCFSLPFCSRAICRAAFQQLSALRSPTPPSALGLIRQSYRLAKTTGSGTQSTIPGQPAQAGTSVHHPFARGTRTSMAALIASLQRIQQLPVPCLWCNGHKCPAASPAPLPTSGTLYRMAAMQSLHNRDVFKTARP